MRKKSGLTPGGAGLLPRIVFSEGEVLELGRRMEQDERFVVMALVWKAKERAMEAGAQLLTVNPNETSQIHELQNEVRRLASLVVWMREIARDARTIADRLTADEREELEDMLYDQANSGSGPLE